ncbi:MAG: zinc ribbon domain-containing protein [Lachnospiraceae bacterium]|nr:zinc ribbon domain-containing protein [Lachnospiraceae bacterium]
MFCSECGNPVAEDMKFCPYCGKIIRRDFIEKEENKSLKTGELLKGEELKEGEEARKSEVKVPKEEHREKKDEPDKNTGEKEESPDKGKNNSLIGAFKGKPLKIIITIVIIALAAFILSALLNLLSYTGYEVNKGDSGSFYELKEGEIRQNSSFFNLSFACDKDIKVAQKSDGIYVLTDSSGVVIIDSKSGATNPKAYFKDYKKMLEEKYPDVKIEDVKELETGLKTVYMVRARINNNGSLERVDRYLELYEKGYIEYTVLSEEGKDYGHEELYSLINSLKADFQ